MKGVVQKLIYIFNARLPTEKAHGYQVGKMCEAFAANGIDVLLLHPYRRQSDPSLQGKDLFEYYGLRQNFQIEALPNFDVVRLERFFSRGIPPSLFFIHVFLWGLYASIEARRREADIYYTRDSVVAYWLLRLGLPTVYEEHVVPHRAQRRILRRIALQSQLRLVVVLTSFIKKHFLQMGFSNEKVVVLPSGMDPSLFANLPSREECRRSLGLPQERPIIGYIGRFQTLGDEKGVPELVQAMAHLQPIDGKEPLLLCVGGPMDVVPAYLNVARCSGLQQCNLRFVDRVPNNEVPFWIRACDVVTIPWPWTEFSAHFTSPLKLFEYMAAGMPIVASDLPSIREVLQHGENAWLVEAGNADALAKGITHVLRDTALRTKIAAEARQSAKKYTWQLRAGSILDQVRGIA